MTIYRRLLNMTAIDIVRKKLSQEIYAPILEKEVEAMFREIDSLATTKYREGAKKHGVFDIAKDKRTLVGKGSELETELLDAINYARMAIIKMRKISDKLQRHGIII